MEPRPRITARVWPEPKPETLRVDEVARILGISQSTVYEQMKRGVIPSLKFGRARRISRPVIDRMLAEGVVGQ